MLINRQNFDVCVILSIHNSPILCFIPGLKKKNNKTEKSPFFLLQSMIFTHYGINDGFIDAF
jgi:hypothetical protein